MPLENHPFMLGTLIKSFRHLKRQNLYTGDDYIYSSGIILLVSFLATREAVALLENHPIMLDTLIQMFRHLEHQYLSIIRYKQSKADATNLEEMDWRRRIGGGGVGGVQLA